jgi:hypothetical protein
MFLSLVYVLLLEGWAKTKSREGDLVHVLCSWHEAASRTPERKGVDENRCLAPMGRHWFMLWWIWAEHSWQDTDAILWLNLFISRQRLYSLSLFFHQVRHRRAKVVSIILKLDYIYVRGSQSYFLLTCDHSFIPIIAWKLLKGAHHRFPVNSLHHIWAGNNFEIPFFCFVHHQTQSLPIYFDIILKYVSTILLWSSLLKQVRLWTLAGASNVTVFQSTIYACRSNLEVWQLKFRLDILIWSNNSLLLINYSTKVSKRS